MADHPIPDAPKPFAHEIAAYSDLELDRYLREHGRIVSVQDPENIPPDFIQRLRDIVQRDRVAAQSCAVDLEQVAARLETLPADPAPFSRSASLATTEPLPSAEERNIELLREETESYSELVSAGGRPLYPLHLLEDFFWNFEKYLEDDRYRDVILYYRAHTFIDEVRTGFCCCQLKSWNRFRTMQRMIRKHSMNSEQGLIRAADEYSWEAKKAKSKALHDVPSSEFIGQWGFSEYAENMKARLKKYGFTRSFQLEHDLERQDKLTTWIEYLGYEYYYYHQSASAVKRKQRRHDIAWQNFVDSGVLLPEETYDTIRNRDRFLDGARLESAERAVKSAMAALSSTEQAIAESHDPTGRLRKRLLDDKSTLDAVKASYDNVKSRFDRLVDFVSATRYYFWDQEDADRHSLLLRWIVKQIPLIELELRTPASPENELDQELSSERRLSPSDESHKAHSPQRLTHAHTHTHSKGDQQAVSEYIEPTTVDVGRRREKRKRGTADLADDIEEPCKRPKSSDRRTSNRRSASGPASATNPVAAMRTTTSSRASAKIAEGSKRGNRSGDQSAQVSQPLRRSARIAGRDQKSRDTYSSVDKKSPENSGVRSVSKRSRAAAKSRNRRW